MPVNRGDVILTHVPNVGSPGGKIRPALIVQSDANNARLNEPIIAAGFGHFFTDAQNFRLLHTNADAS